MNRWHRAMSTILGVAALLAGFSAPARGADDVALNTAPGSELVSPGDTITVRLDVANLTAAINGVQIRFSYDTALMTLVDIVPTDLGLAAPNAGWVEVHRDEVGGDVDYAVVINGGQMFLDHTVATLTFTAIAEGMTAVTFQPDAPPYLTKLTLASDNSTVLPAVWDSELIDITCDDGLFCNGAETFVGGVCVPGTDPCDDTIGCTDDSCDEVNDTCTNAVNDANCDDGLFCNGAEFCDAALDCQPGADPCDDSVGCTDDSCDEVADTCTNAVNDANCDDGLYCNGAEVCDAVLDCQLGTDPCDDSVGCTDDTCDELSDTCTNTANDLNCDDGTFCNGAETCDAALDCQPSVNPCDDGVGCTDDSCDEVGDVCIYAPNDAHCDDGVFCNGAETCDALLDCQASTDPCAPLFCDEPSDSCLAPLQITSLEVFYSGKFADAPDSSKSFLAAGTTATLDNITNYMRGITGIRVGLSQVVTFATTPEAAFTFEWTTQTDSTTFAPVDNPGTAISVIPVDDVGGTTVDILLADDHVRRRWLKVTIDGSQVTSSGVELDGELVGNPVVLPSGDDTPGGDAVFFIGNMTGDVSGDRKTRLGDIGAIRAAANPFLAVPITNLYDVDKDGRVLLGDMGDARLDVNPFISLPLISP